MLTPNSLLTSPEALRRIGLLTDERRALPYVPMGPILLAGNADNIWGAQGGFGLTYDLLRHTGHADPSPVLSGFGGLGPHPQVDVFDISDARTRVGKGIRRSPFLLGIVAWQGMFADAKVGNFAVLIRNPSTLRAMVLGCRPSESSEGALSATAPSAEFVGPFKLLGKGEHWNYPITDELFRETKHTFLSAAYGNCTRLLKGRLQMPIDPGEFGRPGWPIEPFLPLWYEQTKDIGFFSKSTSEVQKLAVNASKEEIFLSKYEEEILKHWAITEALIIYRITGEKPFGISEAYGYLISAAKQLHDPTAAVTAATVAALWDIPYAVPTDFALLARLGARCPQLLRRSLSDLLEEAVVLPPEITVIITGW